jgi:quercetin dioxygenase-like cupin family protein/ligand-binding sensor protein
MLDSDRPVLKTGLPERQNRRFYCILAVGKSVCVNLEIKRYNGEKMTVQTTDWGYVEWQRTCEDDNPRQTMTIMKTVILPGRHQARHIHYGQEQMVYILSGEGIYTVNDEKKRYGAGSVIYMEAGASHETVNDKDAEIRELVVSVPVNARERLKIETVLEKHDEKGILYGAVESLRTQLIEPLRLPMTIFDADHQIVLQTPWFPEFCHHHCHPDKNPEDCACLKNCSFTREGEVSEILCPMNLHVFCLPIVFDGKLIGTIHGGFVLISSLKSELYEGLYEMPESSVLSIKKVLSDIAAGIVDYCRLEHSRAVLKSAEDACRVSEQTSSLLRQNLQNEQNRVTDLKINHHFLFNTLNCMGAMALQDGSERLYDSIINLSDLFRYTMKTDVSFVPFEDELKYLNDYLKLQQLRYRNGLSVCYNVTDDLLGAAVPFNFLQPVAENAFTHGFDRKKKQRNVSLITEAGNGRARIIIMNNGTPIDAVTLNRINRSIASGNGHGLSLIYSKLRSAFGENFTMNIDSHHDKTCVVMDIPLVRMEEMNHDTGNHSR